MDFLNDCNAMVATNTILYFCTGTIVENTYTFLDAWKYI